MNKKVPLDKVFTSKFYSTASDHCSSADKLLDEINLFALDVNTINNEVKIQKVLEHYNYSIEILPHPLFLKRRAKFYFYISEYMDCIKDCNSIIKFEIDEFMPYAYEMRALAKTKLGDLRGALRDYDKALSYSTNPYLNMMSGYTQSKSIVYNEIAEIKIKLKDIKGAIESYDKVLYYFKSAEFFCKLPYHEYDEELENCEEIIILMRLAKLKLQNGDKSGACECWSYAGEYGAIEAYEHIKEHCN
jgi:tetratricopeptide (TPR) repeat protein